MSEYRDPARPGDSSVDQEFDRMVEAHEQQETAKALTAFAFDLGRFRLSLIVAGFSAEEAFALTRDFAQQALAKETLNAMFPPNEDDSAD